MQNCDKNNPVVPHSAPMAGEDRSKLPVAVMDSGVGGLCVLREIHRLLPREELLYFGDGAFAPYGEREKGALTAHIIEEADRLLAESKALVIACNTATALAASALRVRYPDVPIVGMEPALKPALSVCPHPRILVLATSITLREEKFNTLLAECEKNATVWQISAPRIVELLEEGRRNSPEMQAYLNEILAPYRCEIPDAVVLGCTHFPFVKAQILHALGAEVPIFDGVQGTARQLLHVLSQKGLENFSPTRGAVRFTSSRQGVLPSYARLLFGYDD